MSQISRIPLERLILPNLRLKCKCKRTVRIVCDLKNHTLNTRNIIGMTNNSERQVRDSFRVPLAAAGDDDSPEATHNE
jgi:hypothetical protein